MSTKKPHGNREATPDTKAVPPQAPRPGTAPSASAAPDASPGDAGPTVELSRRRLLGTVGAAGAAGLVVGGAGGVIGASAARGDAPAPLTTVGTTRVPFRADRAAHQAGITTPLQASGHLLAFDLAPDADRKAAAALLRRWTRTAQDLMEGRAPAHDTAVAADAGPSSLTVTFGLGHSFFDRTGLTKQRPVQLDPLPDFSADALDARRSNGDLWLQIGADDALVAFHALRTLQKEAAPTARLRWQMNGFNRTPAPPPAP